MSGMHDQRAVRKEEKDLGEVVVGFTNVEKEIAEVSDLPGGVGITIDIAESVDSEGEKYETEYLADGLPHASIT